MAADKSDEPGVLGNLPRSRPGRRSEKRGGARTAAVKAPAATGAKRASKPASARKPADGRKPAAARTSPPPPKQPRPRPEPAAPTRSGSSDPLTGAVRLAGKVAEAGLKTAGGLLRRLPGR